MKKHIFLSIGISMLLLCFIYGFQKKPEPPQQEEHEVEVRLVMVDVIVTKDGKFVIDLRTDEFELYEDGMKVPINSFELISFEEVFYKPSLGRCQQKIGMKNQMSGAGSLILTSVVLLLVITL